MLKGFNGAFNKKSKREHELEDKITRLQNTILEITQENVDLKKRFSNKGKEAFHSTRETDDSGLYKSYRNSQPG